jgi:hypothetical protein
MRDKNDKHEYVIEFPEKNPLTYFYTVIRPLGVDSSNGAFLLSLLEMNLFGLQTDAATISIDKKNNNLLLHITFPVENLTPQLFINILTNFIATARKLRAKLDDLHVRTETQVQKKSERISAAEAISDHKPAEKMRVLRI